MRLLIFVTFILTSLNSYAQTIVGQVLYGSNNEYVEVFLTDYFTYTDSVAKAMAFFPFSNIKYKVEVLDFNVFQIYFDRNDFVKLNIVFFNIV